MESNHSVESGSLSLCFSQCGDGFSSLSAIFELCEELAASIGSGTSRSFDTLRGEIVATLPRPSSGVTYALERRISRENVALAIQLERLANWLKSCLAELPENDPVLILDMQRFDDISIKLMARVVPFTKRNWVLRYDSVPSADKLKLLQRFSEVTQVHVLANPCLSKNIAESSYSKLPSLEVLARELVLTNYGSCFYWGQRILLQGEVKPSEYGETLRILGLAALNRGMFDVASSYLAQSENHVTSPFRKAHLACLQSLVSQKRLYDPAATDAHIARGIDYLENYADKGNAKSQWALEYAWLLNSKALAAALRYRKTTNNEDWRAAMRLVQEAFNLTKGRSSIEHMYLRFNLAANTVFLLEMRGEYESALTILENSFSQALGFGISENSSVPESFEYRRAVLMAKAGRPAEAQESLVELVSKYNQSGAWFLSERVLRTLTYVAARREDLESAALFASKGLGICRSEGSRVGLQIHAKNLSYVCLKLERESEVKAIRELYLNDCSLKQIQDWTIPSAPPKLPAYIPEIDLEEIPSIDLNNFLAQGTKR